MIDKSKKKEKKHRDLPRYTLHRRRVIRVVPLAKDDQNGNSADSDSADRPVDQPMTAEATVA